jgi:hypothetical protein
MFNLQVLAEFTAIVPEEARESKLRVEWSKIRGNVLDAAKKAKKSPDLPELLASMNEFDEGLI